MFGREPRLPMDVFHGNAKDVKYDLDQYHTKLTLHMRDAYKIVKDNLEKYAIKNKIAYDSKVKSHINLNIGDRVLMYKPQINRSKDMIEHAQVWIRDWIGPFTVMGRKYQNKTDVYIIKDEVTSREWTVNLHLLRPYNERPYLNSSRMTELKSSSREELSRDDSQNLNVAPRDAGIVAGSNSDDASSTDRMNTSIPKVIQGKCRSEGKSVSRQEANRKEKRLQDLTTEQNAAVELKEYELEKIISHKRTRRGLMFEVKWVEFEKPTMIHQNQIMTKEIIIDYWRTIPIKDRPVKFRKL